MRKTSNVILNALHSNKIVFFLGQPGPKGQKGIMGRYGKVGPSGVKGHFKM